MKTLSCLAAVLAAGVLLADGEKRVALSLPEKGARSVITVDPAGADRLVATVSVPHEDIQQLWMPDMIQPKIDRKWWITLNAAPQQDMPYAAFFNMNEHNRFSIGAEALSWDSRLALKINQEKGTYEITLTVVAGPQGKLRPFAVTLDRRDIVWTKALDDWRNSLPYPAGKYPDAAWKPVFCSWYAVHAAVTEDWVDRTAAIAAKMGFKTFILDDGWSYDEMKRVNPQTIVTWYRDVGRWDAFSTKKFPHFKEHRERMRALGLKYIVWVAPYFLGTRSEAFKRWGYDKQPFTKPFEGNSLTDIHNKPMMDSVTAQLVKLMRDTDLDGLKIDFLDYIRPSIDDPRGAASLAYIEDLMSQLRAVKPDAIFEYRQSYATPMTAHLATQFRASDVPFEWLANVMQLAQIRLTMGDKIPLHADPIFWSEYESVDNINRHFMAAMAGVPMLSMDLEKMSPAHREIVRKWLAFYAALVEPFQRDGHWQVAYRSGTFAALTATLPSCCRTLSNSCCRTLSNSCCRTLAVSNSCCRTLAVSKSCATTTPSSERTTNHESRTTTLLIVNDAPWFAANASAFDPDRTVILNLTYDTLRFPNGPAIAPATAYAPAFCIK